MQEAALGAVEAIRQDRPLESTHRDIMEAIIVPFLRPVYNVMQDSFAAINDATWKPLNDNRANIERAIRAIGRVEVTGVPGLPFGGTGFAVAPNLILTNHHVAEKFSPAIGFRNLVFHPGRAAGLDLKQEIGSNESILLRVVKVRMVHPHWDAALLEVEGYPADRPVLSLSGRQPDGLAKRLVAVIGYPAFDTRGDAATQFKMFGGLFDKKRLLPGFTMSFRQIESYGHTVEALAHDCSTLGGNSGSAVVDVATGEVLALHFAGIALEANYAVPGWELARDQHVVDLGVRFSSLPAVGSAPAAWLSAWTPLDQTTSPTTAPITRKPKRSDGPALAPDWFEHATTEDIVAALRNDREGATEALKAFLGDIDGERLARELTPPAEEGLFDFDPPPDPDLPEIIWLHGIMGGHLARPGFLRNRKWLDLKELPFGAVPSSLKLASDGVSSADGKRPLEADGQIQSFYSKAEREWRRQRFVVHPYSYDWRKGIESLADELHRLIESLRQQRQRKFMLVAHSMGGLLCCAYAQRHPEWRDAVQRVVFMGSPVGGSYAPVMALNGVYDLIRKLSMVPGNDLDDLRRMCSTLPGLMDMLPAPSLFPDAAEAYSSARWSDGIAPLQRWLDQSRNLKPALTGSPLLERTTLLVSLGHPTVSKLTVEGGFVKSAPATGAGDGTVPAKAAVINGVPAFKVTFDHSAIPKEPAAIDAVVSLAKAGRCDLPGVQPEDLTRVFAPPEAPIIQEAAIEGLTARLGSGDARAADIEWLFRPGMAAPTE